MFCKDCGAEYVNGACPNCAPEVMQQEKEQQTAHEPDYVELDKKPKKKNLVLAIICMATGIASVIWGLGLVGGIAALITGTMYQKQTGESHTMVKIGKGFGIAGIIIWALLIVLLVLYYIIYFVAMVGLFALMEY